jgi:Ca2+-binding RTX toxin-like protein
MIGGSGSDNYYVDDTGDVVSETDANSGTGGSDVVHSYLSSYTLTDNVENGRIASAGAADLTGNSLNNSLYAGASDNILDGSTGNDTAAYSYATAGVNVELSITTAQATGGSGWDTLTSIENLTGSNYNDRLIGNSEANVLTGGTGNDILYGGGGADYMIGGNGKDYIYCGTENDGDVLEYSNTAESQGSGRDVVFNFNSANVRIDLSRIDANTSVAGDQAFGYSVSSGNISSTAKANGLWFSNEILYGDVDGNTTADFEIQLVGATSFALDTLTL